MLLEDATPSLNHPDSYGDQYWHAFMHCFGGYLIITAILNLSSISQLSKLSIIRSKLPKELKPTKTLVSLPEPKPTCMPTLSLQERIASLSTLRIELVGFNLTQTSTRRLQMCPSSQQLLDTRHRMASIILSWCWRLCTCPLSIPAFLIQTNSDILVRWSRTILMTRPQW